jgi:hypothetical protein
MTWPLLIDETDGVEVLAALELAGKLYRLTGDKVVGDHYMQLAQKLADQAGDPFDPYTDTQRPEPEHSMVVAYHSLYDFKDTLTPGSAAFMHAYNTLKDMSDAMHDMGITPPVRFDAPRGA